MIEELTKLLINQYEKEKKTGQAEYLKISVQDFYYEHAEEVGAFE